MTDTKRQWLIRALAGALAGIAAHVLLGYALGCFSLIGPAHFRGFVFPYCGFPYEIEWAGTALSFALFALLGAEAGIATLPFADSGRELVVRSLIHYAATAATVSLWAGLNICSTPADYLAVLVPLTLVYVLVWLGRWVGWFAEAAAIREKLGLAPGPSLFHWRESLPYVGFALLLCLVLPTALRLLDAPTPVLSVLYAFLLLPVGGFMSGLSLGRRHGFCPLYPVACLLFTLAFILTARLYTNMADGALIPIALISVLAGNLAGAARHRMKKGADAP